MPETDIYLTTTDAIVAIYLWVEKKITSTDLNGRYLRFQRGKLAS